MTSCAVRNKSARPCMGVGTTQKRRGLYCLFTLYLQVLLKRFKPSKLSVLPKEALSPIRSSDSSLEDLEPYE